MAGDDPQDVHGDPGVGHPGEAGVPEIVTPQVFQTEPGDDLVPLRGVTEDGGGDPTATRAGEESFVRALPALVQAPSNGVPHNLTPRNFAQVWLRVHVAGQVREWPEDLVDAIEYPERLPGRPRRLGERRRLPSLADSVLQPRGIGLPGLAFGGRSFHSPGYFHP